MWAHLFRFLEPPTFADERKTRAAGILHVILLTVFIVLGVLAFFTDHPVTFFVTAGMSGLFLFLWLVMRRGFVKLANWGLMIILIAGVTAIIYLNGSIRVPSASAFVAAIVVAGLTLGKRATVGFSILISAILFFLYRAEVTGKLPAQYYTATGHLQWLTYVGILCTTAVLLMLAQESILKALALARRSAEELAERNQELRAEIAERQQAERALRESEELYRTLFELETDAILLIDTENEQILDANPAASQLYGYDRVDLYSMRPVELTPEPVQSWHATPAEDEIVHIPKRFDRRKDGTVFPVEVVGRFFQWQGKNLLLCTARDMTTQVRAEEALREHRERLEDLVQERTSQLTAANQELESFSYSVAHDLRAPLRAISGFSQAILEDFANQMEPEMHFYLERVIDASTNMGQLIDALLSLSRLTTSEMLLELVDLSALARTVIEELRQRDPERNVEVVIADELTVTADCRLMRVVLTNLLGNAWKFTAQRERGRIELGKEEGSFFVRDNGAGFDMAYADRLFGVFQRLHSEEDFSGTGIGLVTVKRIIHRHHGEVWAEGEVEKGATFYFTVP